MASSSRWFGAALLLAALPALTAAQTIDVQLKSERIFNLAENRRNPGEMGPVALGDINGDGYGDLVAASPRAGGFTVVDTGVVYVRFGGNFQYLLDPSQDDGGLYFDLTADPALVANPTTSAVILPDSLNRTPSGLQVNAERGGELFGSAVATGDFDNDDFLDLAISAPASLSPSEPGAVYIIYGRADIGGVTGVDVEITNSLGLEILGREAGARFGEALTVADLDADGADDLIIGTPRAGTGGTVDIVWGGTRNTGRATIDSLPTDVTTILSATAGERFGTALAAAEMSGDTFDDLLIGAPRWPVSATASGRAVGINLSGTRPLVVDLSLTPPYFQIQDTVAGNGTGAAVAAADYDGDGLTDIVLGAPLASPVEPNCGSVFLIRTATSLGGITASLPADADVTIQGAQAQEQLGTALAFADFDSVSGMDLLAGAPGTDQAALTRSGAAYLFSGGGFPDGTYDRLDPASPTIRLQVLREDFRLGTYLATGQMDAVRREDLFIAGSGANPFPASCGTSDPAAWQQCHDFREGVGVYGTLSGSIPTAAVGLSVKPGWMMAE